MLDFYSVVNAPTGKLKSAIDSWSDTITKLEDIKRDVPGQITKPVTDSGWSGESATAGLAFMKKVTAEVADAIAEAKGIKSILTSAHSIILQAKKDLQTIRDHDAPEQRLWVDSRGKVYKASERETEEPPEKTQAKIDALERRIKKIVASASEADDDAAWALRANLGKGDYNFSSPVHKSLDSADKAQKDAQTILDMAKKGHEMSNEELAKFNTIMKRHQNDPVFGEKLATTWGAEKTLKFWAEMADPYQATGDPERVKLLKDLQKSLGTSLSSATHYDSPAMDRWENRMVSLGPKQLGTDHAGNPWGFQVMSNLMRHGEYDSKFLLDYGNALVKTDKQYNDADIPFWTSNANTADLNYGDKNDRGRDPMSGFLQALGHNPEASAEFFKHEGPGEEGKKSEEGKEDAGLSENFKYLTKDRTWYPDATMNGDSDKVQGYNHLGHALESATTGHAYDAFGKDTPAEELGDFRDQDTANVMKQVVASYGSDPAMMHEQPGIGDNLGRIGAAYIDELNRGLEDYGNASQHAEQMDESPFAGKYGEQLFSREESRSFLSTLGQSEAAHNVISGAQHNYTMSVLESISPQPGSDGNQSDLIDAKTAVRIGAETHGILDNSRIAQIEEDYKNDDEAQREKLGKVNEWVKWGTGAVIGGGVGLMTGGAGAAVAVPLAAETVGSAVSTWLGQEIDDAMKKGEQDSGDSVEEARKKTRESGEELAASPAAVYWGDPEWSNDERNILRSELESAAKDGRSDAGEEPWHDPHKRED